MTLPKDKHRFLTTIAELAQDIMRHSVKVGMSAGGMPSRYRLGLSGKILDALYDKRLQDLTTAMRATPLGSAVMDYLQDENVYIDFDHRMSSRGSVGLNKVIYLKSGAKNAELVGVIAHEARHVWQFSQLRAELRCLMPPEAHIGTNIYMEADAFSFQQKFLEDYSRRTGNSQPLDSLLQVDKGRSAPLGVDDTARFVHYTNVIRNSEVYTAQAMGRVVQDYERMKNAEGPFRAPSRVHAADMMADIAQKIGQCWPFINAQGGHDSYLSRFSRQEIVALGRPSAAALHEMNVYCWHYDQMTNTAGAHTPTLGIKKTPR